MRREYVCKNPQCAVGRYHLAYEIPSMTGDSDSPVCGCGAREEIRAYPVKVVFTGVISARYNDRGIPGESQEGHWAYGRDPLTKKPIPRFIETWDDQRSFCKEFGYVNPKEMPRNFSPSEDGKGIANTRGMPGTEI